MQKATRLNRRTTLKWMLAAAGIAPRGIFEQANALAGSANDVPAGRAAAIGGYGLDPNLLEDHRAGAYWPLTLSDAERRAAAVLCDLIIPQDTFSPSASAVGVVDFLDEWISAPYPEQAADRVVVLEVLTWMDTESASRFSLPFAALQYADQRALCDPVCFLAQAAKPLQRAAYCFARYRDLTATGFYTSPAGRRDLNFVGNVPSTRFDGPPLEVLHQAGLDAQ